jgi:predicted transcriptional regulator
MSTTTIRIDEKLKECVALPAKRSGKSTHGYILDAIAHSVEASEAEADFHRTADARWDDILATGKTVPWEDVRSHLEARNRGGLAPTPRARSLKR